MIVFRLTVLKAIPAFAVAALGVLMAWTAFRVTIWIPVVLTALAITLGGVQFWRGKRRLPEDPVGAVDLMEWFVLVPGTVVAVLSGVLIAVAVFLEPAEKASEETKKLLAAASAAFGGFLAAAFIKSAEDADAEWVGQVVKAEFVNVYQSVFDPGTDGANALTSNIWKGISGWGRIARHRRAKEISKALAEKRAGAS